MSSATAAKSVTKKAKKTTTEQTTTPAPSKYQRTFSEKRGCVSARGAFLSLHKVGAKLYIEIPNDYLEREVLIAATVTGTSDSDVATLGAKARKPLYGRFVRRDSSIFLERITVLPEYRRDDSLSLKNIRQTNLNTVIGGGKIFCESDDKQRVVFEATSLFRTTDELSALGTKTVSGLTLKAKLETAQCTFDAVKAFDDNVSIKSTLSYTVSSSLLGLLSVLKDAPVNVQVTHSILLLPERKMQQRMADIRVGTFLTDQRSFDKDADKIVNYSVVNRWRLEPKDTTAMLEGRLSDPIKPIVFYLDDALPAQWREAAEIGILRWNKAFEAIGFSNAVQVKPFPKDDPEFDPDNVKYSCVRYVPTAVSNAQGPSWVDPATGEILSASVLVYNDVTKLINNWRFSQTAQLDERVRAVKMPDEVMRESMAYVLSHEVGHCLGFMHNMAASSSYPVDSLRSATFTQQYGTTPSIMDYARFNYVAQPGDKGVRLTPPDLGLYDYYLVQYAYRPIFEAKNSREEIPVLRQWVENHASDARYRYGRQQLAYRCDPTAIEEDLGDDAMRASDYGIANLKYIIAHMNEWITDNDDADYEHRQELYAAIVKQYNRYVQAVMMNIGGIRLYDDLQHHRAESVEADYQHRATAWVIAQLRASDWLDTAAGEARQPLHVDYETSFVASTFADLVKRLNAVVLSSHVSGEQQPYDQTHFMQDLYNGVWQPTNKGQRLTAIDRMMQSRFVDACLQTVAKSGATSAKSTTLSMGDAFAPSMYQLTHCCYDCMGEEHHTEQQLEEWATQCDEAMLRTQLCDFGKAGYNWQRAVSIRVIDETPTLWYDVAVRCEKLLATRVATTTVEADKAHYKLLLYRLRKALSEN